MKRRRKQQRNRKHQADNGMVSIKRIHYNEKDLKVF